jgi:hypothetical protein
MYLPPETICGFPAKYQGPPEAGVEAHGLVLLRIGAAVPTTFLRWKLSDFVSSNPEPWMSDGWVRTILVDLGTAQWHLSQGSSPFWSTHPDLCFESASNSERRHPEEAPVWHRRSDRYWPRFNGRFLPFLGQGCVGEHDLYLFGDLSAAMLTAHLVSRTEQDVEDHYDQET